MGDEPNGNRTMRIQRRTLQRMFATVDMLSNTPAGPAEISGPSIFTALQQELRLKLEPQKGPAPILVIDKVERLSATYRLSYV